MTEQPRPAEGPPAPGFPLPDAEGRIHSLAGHAAAALAALARLAGG